MEFHCSDTAASIDQLKGEMHEHFYFKMKNEKYKL